MCTLFSGILSGTEQEKGTLQDAKRRQLQNSIAMLLKSSSLKCSIFQLVYRNNLRGTFFFFFLATPRGMQDLPRPGIQPMPPALGAQNLNHWTAMEVQGELFWGNIFLVTNSLLQYLITFLISTKNKEALLHGGRS